MLDLYISGDWLSDRYQKFILITSLTSCLLVGFAPGCRPFNFLPFDDEAHHGVTRQLSSVKISIINRLGSPFNRALGNQDVCQQLRHIYPIIMLGEL